MTEYIFYQSVAEGAGVVTVSPDRYYDAGSGFGFFTENSRMSAKQGELPELNTGFVPSAWFQGKTMISQDFHGCYVDSGSILADMGICGERKIPLSFKADLKAQGSFLLTVTLYAGEDESEILLFAGRRQLVWKGSLKKGEGWTGSFPVTICDIIPRGETTRWKDQAVEVTVISRSARLSQLQIDEWNGKTMFIAGDSTVTDQSAEYPYAPETSYSGWGQMLPMFLNETMAVSNHAHSGLTTESFRKEGHYAILMESISSGDICLFQFGHNDQKLDHLKAEEGYRANLLTYIVEIREKGAVPVLVTPLARNTWKGSDGTYNDLLKGYADEVIRIGKDMSVPVLDLHRKSMEVIMEHGMEESKRWFYPSDYTHTNDYGACLMAGFIMEELIKAGITVPGGSEMPSWEPAKKGTESFPDCPVSMDSTAKAEAFMPDRPEDNLTRAEALDFVIRAVHYFPTNVYNDLFSDVIGHEWFAGTIECAVQNGLIPQEMAAGGHFSPNQDITLEEFLWIAVTGYKSRKQQPEKISTAAEGTLPWTRESTGIACALGAVDSKDNWKRSITRREAAAILGRFGI